MHTEHGARLKAARESILHSRLMVVTPGKYPGPRSLALDWRAGRLAVAPSARSHIWNMTSDHLMEVECYAATSLAKGPKSLSRVV